MQPAFRTDPNFGNNIRLIQSKMKKFLLVASAVIALTGCSSDESDFVQVSQEVNVSLSYSLVESGSMTRNSGEVYSDFYEKYIKTKQLAPKTFDLTFKNKETGATAVVRGDWNKNHSFKLLTGVYEVTGTSHPQTSNCIDSLYLCFNESVEITEATANINLTAIYDSYMLMFDKNDKENVKYGRLRGKDKHKYEMMFAIRKALEKSNNWSEFQKKLNRDNIHFTIKTVKNQVKKMERKREYK